MVINFVRHKFIMDNGKITYDKITSPVALKYRFSLLPAIDQQNSVQDPITIDDGEFDMIASQQFFEEDFAQQEMNPVMKKYFNSPVTYELNGYVTHTGPTMMAGHYEAVRKDVLTGDWYYFNDSHYELIASSSDSEENIKQKVLNHHLAASAYMVFYDKI
jgi:ubiquitin C-terminal hydrolase